MEKVNTYDEIVVKLLMDNGYMYSTDLIVKLQLEAMVSYSYARKIIQRAFAKGVIKSSKPVVFKSGQQILYLMNDVVCSRMISKVNFPKLKKYRMSPSEIRNVAKLLKSINMLTTFVIHTNDWWDIKGNLGDGLAVSVKCLKLNIGQKEIRFLENDHTKSLRILIYKNRISKKDKEHLFEMGIIIMKYDNLLCFGNN